MNLLSIFEVLMSGRQTASFEEHAMVGRSFQGKVEEAEAEEGG